MNSLNRCRYKGQALALDTAIACVLALLILLIGIRAVSSALQHAEETEEQISLESRAISIADFLVKEGAAFKENSSYGLLACSHEIDGGRLSALDLPSTCVELLKPGQRASCSGRVCVKRPVILHSSMEAGFLVVCAE